MSEGRSSNSEGERSDREEGVVRGAERPGGGVGMKKGS